MESDIDDDLHMCLVCHTTIQGLLNYVEHKKTSCQGRSKPLGSDVLGQGPCSGTASSTSDTLTVAVSNASVVGVSPGSRTESLMTISTSASSILSPDMNLLSAVDFNFTSASSQVLTTSPLTSTKSSESSVLSTSKSLISSATSLFTSPDYALNSNPLLSSSQDSLTLSNFVDHPRGTTQQSRQTHTGLVDDLQFISSQAGQQTNLQQPVHVDTSIQSGQTDNSQFPSFRPECMMSPTSVGTVNPNEVISGQGRTGTADNVDDFFSSLELRSKTDMKDQRIENTVQKTIPSIPQVDLPISSILGNLNFSSDDEDMDFQFPDDVSVDQLTDDSDNDMGPPRSHTGGKWKPGEGPASTQLRRSTYSSKGKWRGHARKQGGGKWKPGMLGKKRGRPVTQKKIYCCTFCCVTFENRFLYSNHCGSFAHKEKVFGKESMEKRPTMGTEKKEGPLLDEGKGRDSKETQTVSEAGIAADAEVVEPTVKHFCTICNKKYYNKYIMARHLLTRFHKNRSIDHPDALPLIERYHKYIVRLCPFQCEVCRFYFNLEENFMKHMKTEKHLTNCQGLTGELLCTLCSFKSHFHEELLQHFNGQDHKTNVEKRSGVCIVKENHIKMKCKYCGKIMKSYARLKRHIAVRHGDGKSAALVTRVKGGNHPTCSECGLKCASPSALKCHVARRHLKEKRYKCKLCDKAFSDKGGLGIHLKSMKHIKAVMEEENLVQEQKWEIHMYKADNKKVQTELTMDELVSDTVQENGNNCPEKFSQEESTPEKDLPEIMQDVEDTDVWEPRPGKLRKKREPAKLSKAIKCNHCDFTAKNYNDLRPHYLIVHSSEVRLCEVCDLVFLSAKALRLHVLSKVHQENVTRSEGTKDVKYFQCKICKKKFTEDNYCRFHEEFQHHSLCSEDAVIRKFGGNDLTRQKYGNFLLSVESMSRDDRIKCPDCPSTLKNSNLIEHLRMHCGDKPFECRLCSKGFISAVSLRRHLLGHFGCQERTCDICGKEYKKTASFEQHMAKHQMESSGASKLHTCEVCGQSFFFPYQLTQHRRRHRERNFKCTVPGCHWKFVYRNELTYHMRSHNKEKPYLCSTCGYGATTKTRLLRHQRTHSGERKFHCEYCTYKAGNSTHLHRHMRIHIGSKPYKCPYCDYRCNTHENIRKHIIQTKKHEGLKIYPCKFCIFGTNSSADFRNHLIENHSELVENENLHNALAAFTGLYEKDQDPKQPLEGTLIIQTKEKDTTGDRKKREPLKRKKREKGDNIQKEEDVHFGDEMCSQKNRKKTMQGMSPGEEEGRDKMAAGNLNDEPFVPPHSSEPQVVNIDLIPLKPTANVKPVFFMPNMFSQSSPATFIMQSAPSSGAGTSTSAGCNVANQPHLLYVDDTAQYIPQPMSTNSRSLLKNHHLPVPNPVRVQVPSSRGQDPSWMTMQPLHEQRGHEMAGRSLLQHPSRRFSAHSCEFKPESDDVGDEEEQDLVIDMAAYTESV